MSVQAAKLSVPFCSSFQNVSSCFRLEQLFVDLMNTSVITNLSRLPVILPKTPAYLLQQIVMTGSHLKAMTL